MSTEVPQTFAVEDSTVGSITHKPGRVEVRRTVAYDPRHSTTDVWALNRAELLDLWGAIGDYLMANRDPVHAQLRDAMARLVGTTPRMPVDLDDPEYHTPPSKPLPPSRSVCDARARIGTGEGSCSRLLDRYGQCDRAGDHL